jgi:hypothetical protein
MLLFRFHPWTREWWKSTTVTLFHSDQNQQQKKVLIASHGEYSLFPFRREVKVCARILWWTVFNSHMHRSYFWVHASWWYVPWAFTTVKVKIYLVDAFIIIPAIPGCQGWWKPCKDMSFIKACNRCGVRYPHGLSVKWWFHSYTWKFKPQRYEYKYIQIHNLIGTLKAITSIEWSECKWLMKTLPITKPF